MSGWRPHELSTVRAAIIKLTRGSARKKNEVRGEGRSCRVSEVSGEAWGMSDVALCPLPVIWRAQAGQLAILVTSDRNFT